MRQLLPSLFHGRHFDRSIILLCVRWYITYKLSYRDLVQMMAERGIDLAHTTILRWVRALRPGVREAMEWLVLVQSAHRGAWMKPTPELKDDGLISIVPLISPVQPRQQRASKNRNEPRAKQRFHARENVVNNLHVNDSCCYNGFQVSTACSTSASTLVAQAIARLASHLRACRHRSALHSGA